MLLEKKDLHEDQKLSRANIVKSQKMLFTQKFMVTSRSAS